MNFLFRPFMIIAAIALITGCGAEGESPGEPLDEQQTITRDLAFELNLSGATSSGLNLSRAEIILNGDSLERTLTVSVDSDTVNVSFSSLPQGSYSIQVNLYDGDDLVAEGSGTAQVSRDSVSSVNILVNPISGNLEIGICIPDLDAQYLNGNLTGTLLNNEQTRLVDLSQAATQRYLSAVTGFTDIDISYRVGDAAIPAMGEATFLPNVFQDHGASFRLSSEGDELLALSGCNTQVALSRSEDVLSLLFVMPESYEADFPVELSSVNLGSIEANGLVMMIQWLDTNGDTGLANATQLSDLDFSKFEDRIVSLGVPLVTGLSGMAGTLVTSYTALIDEGFYLSRIE